MDPSTPRPKLVGIVNITTDSFSDGGRYLEPQAAIAHARKLVADGADFVELGPASSHPDSAKVSAETEIARLSPVLASLKAAGTALAVDTPQKEVQLFAARSGVALLNDVRGFPDPSIYEALASADSKLVVMHSVADGTHAERHDTSVEDAFASVSRFFDRRLAELTAAGISRSRLIVDPGMGFFLSSRPEPSIAMLARIGELKRRFGCPVMISVSRKSFLRNAVKRPDDRIEVRTLAAEISAWMQGADYIRTHDVAAIEQAIAVMAALAASSRADDVPRL